MAIGLLYDLTEVVLHGELAVPCTRNPLQRGGIPSPGLSPRPLSFEWMSRAGSWAAEAREPRQVRKEAAVSGSFRVLQGSLARVPRRGMSWVSGQRRVHGFFILSWPIRRISRPALFAIL